MSVATTFPPWPWPLVLTDYDRTPALTSAERQALACLDRAHGFGGRTLATVLDACAPAGRLLAPLRAAMAAIDGNPYWKERALVALLRGCLWEDQAFWGWDPSTWARLLAPQMSRQLTANQPNRVGATRHYLIAAAYLLDGLPDLGQIDAVEWRGIAQKALGRPVATSIARIDAVLAGWGYAADTRRTTRSVTARALLQRRSPHLEHLTAETLTALRNLPDFSDRRRGRVAPLTRALVELGIVTAPRRPDASTQDEQRQWTTQLAPAWGAAVRRWEATTTLAPTTRVTTRTWLLKVGRWAWAQQPAASEPAAWDRRAAADVVAAITQLRVGDYCFRPPSVVQDHGKPLAPRSKLAVESQGVCKSGVAETATVRFSSGCLTSPKEDRTRWPIHSGWHWQG